MRKLGAKLGEMDPTKEGCTQGLPSGSCGAPKNCWVPGMGQGCQVREIGKPGCQAFLEAHLPVWKLPGCDVCTSQF